MLFKVFTIVLPILFAALSSDILAKKEGSWRIETITPPAGLGTSQPNLTVGRDRVYLNWLGSVAEAKHQLNFAKWDGRSWSSPKTIVGGVPFFVNWADFPSMLVSDQLIAAHWLEKSGEGVYAYDVKLSVSRDDGKTWGPAMIPHTDRSPDEHGFVSLIDRGNGKFSTIWLDARNNKKEGESGVGAMMLMSADYIDGQFKNETTIDSRVCDCCQTDGAVTNEGMFIAYRDRSQNEIRDISYALFEKGKWSSPRTLHADGWNMPGCPVNGPAVAVSGKKIAVAWFTAAAEQPRVFVSVSHDGGHNFGAPLRIDQGTPNGRVDLEFLRDDSLMVSWLEHVGDGAEIRVREITNAGRLEPFLTVASATEARASGFPRIARFGDDVLIAWTEAAENSQIRMVRITQQE